VRNDRDIVCLQDRCILMIISASSSHLEWDPSIKEKAQFIFWLDVVKGN